MEETATARPVSDPSSEWIWMPHPGHFICSFWCRFHLTTVVHGGEILISTVGEYLPEEDTRESLARARGVELEGRGDARLQDFLRKLGYEEIGLDRKYETMIFPARPDPDTGCCPFVASDWGGLDMRGYNDPHEARIGHLELCWEWEKKEIE